MLDIMLPLLEGETVTYHGRYYSVDDVFIEPRTASGRRYGWAAAPSWPTSSHRTYRSSSNRSRRARSAPTADPATDLPAAGHRPRLERAADYFGEHGQDASELSIAHENFLHLVLSNDPVKAREEQHRAFLKVMSGERGRRLPRVRVPVRDARRDRRLAQARSTRASSTSSCTR